MTLQAWPLPADMGEIIDYMECWGRGEDAVWYHNVVNWIGFICREGIKRDRLGLMYDCVALRVRMLIEQNMGGQGTTQPTRRLLQQWREYFFTRYEHGVTDFATLKRGSIVYVRGVMSNMASSVAVLPPLVTSTAERG